MRALNVVCGLAVLLTTLHLAHAIHHFYTHSSPQDLQSPIYWLGMAVAGIMGVLSLVGGVLLLAQARRRS